LNIARWDASTWSPFGSSLNGSSEDFALLPNGQLAMVGVTLNHQVLQAELGPTANITWLGGLNALVLTTDTY